MHPLMHERFFFLIYWIWFYSTLEVIVCSMTLVHIRNQFFPMSISNMTTMINLSWNWTKLDRICNNCNTMSHVQPQVHIFNPNGLLRLPYSFKLWPQKIFHMKMIHIVILNWCWETLKTTSKSSKISSKSRWF